MSKYLNAKPDPPIVTPIVLDTNCSPNDESAIKALYLAIRQASRNWKMIHNWKPALQTFQVMFGEDRVPLNLVY